MARVVYSKCEVDAQVIADADGKEEAVCPGCGQRDKVEDAIRIAGEHVADQAKALLNQALEDVARSSKFIQFQSGFEAWGTFRWKAAD